MIWKVTDGEKIVYTIASNSKEARKKLTRQHEPFCGKLWQHLKAKVAKPEPD